MECIYCHEESEFRRSIMEELCTLPYSTVYVFRSQTYYGRCVVAFRLRHVNELFELTAEERQGYMDDVARTASAIQRAVGAEKINYAIYGDLMPHVHFHLFTSKPINTVDDFKGLKIRTMENPVDVGIFNAIGAQATPMAYSELFTAIQQGTVDGGENTIANYLSDGFSEVAPYLTLSGHTYNICIILISNEAIEKIPADMRDAFFAACKDGIAQASAMVLQANEDAIETLKANGATITDIDRTALYELCKPLYEEFANDRIPTELVEMVNAAK